MTLWGLQNAHPELGLVEGGFISVGWEELGDLTTLSQERDQMRTRLADAYPAVRAGTIALWGGMLRRFRFEMEVGDLVVYPYKSEGTLNFGRIESDYYYDAEAAEMHPHRRRVTWIQTRVPRADLSRGALAELGSPVTLFKVQHHVQELEAHINGAGASASVTTRIEPEVTTPVAPDLTTPDVTTPDVTTQIEPDVTAQVEPNLTEQAAPGVIPQVEPDADDVLDDVVGQAGEELSAERIETYTRDFVVQTLLGDLAGAQFEQFVASLLRAMGYRTQVTQASGDDGVDVIAHHDVLGLQPPIIKLQCKRTAGPVGAKELQQLLGTLAYDRSELGLFVTLGSYSAEALNIGRNRPDLRLVNGRELVDLVFEHYERLEPKWQQLIPLRRMYVVDRSADAS